jgi:acetyl-CoA carboxylase carboxyl transferase subunit beta
MSWFNRTDKGILTPTESKREVPDGLWFKSPAGKIVHTRELKNNAYVVPEEDYHVRIGSEEYFEILFDNNEFTELDANMESADPLKFKDTKPYPKRIKETQAKVGLKDAVRTAYGKMNGLEITIACMDFSFIGGSMGSVVGEKIARAMDHSLKNKIPCLMISRSGGARMMEAGLSLNADGKNFCEDRAA